MMTNQGLVAFVTTHPGQVINNANEKLEILRHVPPVRPLFNLVHLKTQKTAFGRLFHSLKC